MKQFIIFILLSFFLVGFAPYKADFSDDASFSKLEKSKQAVWKIHRLDQERIGTGFFIGPNHFVTSLHVIDSLLHESPPEDTSQDYESGDQNAIDHIYLSQEGNFFVLKIKKILAVSALYSLALFETEESVINYLSLREDPPELNESLFSIAYPKGVFTKIKKTGNIFYEDDQRYDFPVNHSFLPGAVVGSPILDEQGQVVGTTFYSIDNLLGGIKINQLRGLLKGNIGIKCTDLNSSDETMGFYAVQTCIEAEVENLRELAKQGHAEAQFLLALMHIEKSFGVDQDFEKAFQWFERSAEQGHVKAQTALASMYEGGKGTERDWDKAYHWYEKAAEQGGIKAQLDLAIMYFNGEGVEQDYGKAFQWLEKAAEQGYSWAQFSLGNMYFNGEGVEQDYGKAFQWLEKAAEQGDIKAQTVLGNMYFYGVRVEQGFQEAVYWYEKAAEQGDSDAQFNLALAYYKGWGTQRDLDKALKWIEEAKKQGYPSLLLLMVKTEKTIKSLLDNLNFISPGLYGVSYYPIIP